MPHQTEQVQLQSPTNCDFCGRFIWGLNQNATGCKDCSNLWLIYSDLKVHNDCAVACQELACPLSAASRRKVASDQYQPEPRGYGANEFIVTVQKDCLITVGRAPEPVLAGTQLVAHDTDPASARVEVAGKSWVGGVERAVLAFPINLAATLPSAASLPAALAATRRAVQDWPDLALAETARPPPSPTQPTQPTQLNPTSPGPNQNPSPNRSQTASASQTARSAKSVAPAAVPAASPSPAPSPLPSTGAGKGGGHGQAVRAGLAGLAVAVAAAGMVGLFPDAAVQSGHRLVGAGLAVLLALFVSRGLALPLTAHLPWLALLPGWLAPLPTLGLLLPLTRTAVEVILASEALQVRARELGVRPVARTQEEWAQQHSELGRRLQDVGRRLAEGGPLPVDAIEAWLTEIYIRYVRLTGGAAALGTRADVRALLREVKASYQSLCRDLVLRLASTLVRDSARRYTRAQVKRGLQRVAREELSPAQIQAEAGAGLLEAGGALLEDGERLAAALWLVVRLRAAEAPPADVERLRAAAHIFAPYVFDKAFFALTGLDRLVGAATGLPQATLSWLASSLRLYKFLLPVLALLWQGFPLLESLTGAIPYLGYPPYTLLLDSHHPLYLTVRTALTILLKYMTIRDFCLLAVRLGGLGLEFLMLEESAVRATLETLRSLLLLAGAGLAWTAGRIPLRSLFIREPSTAEELYQAMAELGFKDYQRRIFIQYWNWISAQTQFLFSALLIAALWWLVGFVIPHGQLVRDQDMLPEWLSWLPSPSNLKLIVYNAAFVFFFFKSTKVDGDKVLILGVVYFFWYGLGYALALFGIAASNSSLFLAFLALLLMSK